MAFFVDALSPLAKKNPLKNVVYVWLSMIKNGLCYTDYSFFTLQNKQQALKKVLPSLILFALGFVASMILSVQATVKQIQNIQHQRTSWGMAGFQRFVII